VVVYAGSPTSIPRVRARPSQTSGGSPSAGGVAASSPPAAQQPPRQRPRQLPSPQPAQQPAQQPSRQPSQQPSQLPTSPTPQATQTLAPSSSRAAGSGSADSQSSSTGASTGASLSSGTTAGVAVGCAALVALIAVAAVCMSRGKERRGRLDPALRAASLDNSFSHHDVYRGSAGRASGAFHPHVIPSAAASTGVTRPASSGRASFSAGPRLKRDSLSAPRASLPSRGSAADSRLSFSTSSSRTPSIHGL
jgi:hypothetical protein